MMLNHVWFDGSPKSNVHANGVRKAKSAVVVEKERRTVAGIVEQTFVKNADYEAILPLFGFVAVSTSICSANENR
jgi:hypothetical protein